MGIAKGVFGEGFELMNLRVILQNKLCRLIHTEGSGWAWATWMEPGSWCDVRNHARAHFAIMVKLEQERGTRQDVVSRMRGITFCTWWVDMIHMSTAISRCERDSVVPAYQISLLRRGWRWIE